MDRWKLWLLLLLLLPLCCCLDHKVMVGEEPDVFAVCTNKPQSDFTVECKISTERTKDERCLLYQNSWGLVKQCDSRFTLAKENETVFLRLTSLTPVDSGNYTCVCSRPEKTYVLPLNITVEGYVKNGYEGAGGIGLSGTVAIVVVVVVAVIVAAGLVLARKLREEDWRQLISRLRDHMRSESPESSVCEASCSQDQDDPDQDYNTLQHQTDDIYQNIPSTYHQDKAERWPNNRGRNKTVTFLEDKTYKVTRENEEIYENVCM